MQAIEVDRVTKTYRIGVGRARVREMLPWPVDRAVARLFPRWWSRSTFNALEDVSVSVPPGASVGIVGHNGAGKTTLLKIIAGVTAPNRGAVHSQGRVGALIDVLVGFHPDLTGGENVYLLGAIHGLGRRAMAERVGRIFEFAEIDEMADTPGKRYSSGMQARLGFATLVAINPEILLIDEVLAVGDANFQRKCVAWLQEYQEGGGTLLFVSHNLGLVRSMTERILWLDHGKLVGDGEAPEILGRYARAMERRDPSEGRIQATRATRRRTANVMRDRGEYRWGAGGARLEEVNVQEPDENGGDLEIAMTYRNAELDRAVFCVGFVDESGQQIGATASPPLDLEGETGVVRCSIRPAPFRTGIYFPVAAILSPDGRVHDRWRLDRAIVVDGNGDSLVQDFGPVAIPAAWSED
jgi:ABC-type polysaccharide/polyol phosphate transport system ATPase subunit